MATALLFALLGSSDADTATDWRLLHNEHGVSVWEREMPGLQRAQFRARAVLQAPAIAITAVIFDTEHTREWNHNCKANYLIAMPGAGHAITYNRSGSPVFFLSERDLVVEYKITLDNQKHAARTTFRNLNLPDIPPVDGVVRMPLVQGYYEVRELDSVNTEVVYDITADPGGAVPGWIAEWASRSLIGGVMQRLREQAHQPMYRKLIGELQRSLDWRGFVMPVDRAG